MTQSARVRGRPQRADVQQDVVGAQAGQDPLEAGLEHRVSLRPVAAPPRWPRCTPARCSPPRWLGPLRGCVARSSGSEASVVTARARSAGPASRPTTRALSPSRRYSPEPPVPVATTGVPTAIASSGTSPTAPPTGRGTGAHPPVRRPRAARSWSPGRSERGPRVPGVSTALAARRGTGRRPSRAPSAGPPPAGASAPRWPCRRPCAHPGARRATAASPTRGARPA